MKLLVVSLFLCSLALASYEEGAKVFQKKCSSCHTGYIDPEIIKRNFFQEDNKLLNLTAPTENMLAWAIMKGPKHIGEEGDDFRSIEIEEYLRSVLRNPDREETICVNRVFQYYKKMPLVDVSDEEIKALVDFFMEYDKHHHQKAKIIQKVQKPKNKFERLLLQAQKIQKPLLVEITSSHCWYCKNMKKNVLHDKEVATFLKKHFIFYELNIDKEKIPLVLQKRYKHLTPSFFIVNEKGQIVADIAGSWNKKDFLEFLKEGLNESH